MHFGVYDNWLCTVEAAKIYFKMGCIYNLSSNTVVSIVPKMLNYLLPGIDSLCLTTASAINRFSSKDRLTFDPVVSH